MKVVALVQHRRRIDDVREIIPAGAVFDLNDVEAKAQIAAGTVRTADDKDLALADLGDPIHRQTIRLTRYIPGMFGRHGRRVPVEQADAIEAAYVAAETAAIASAAVEAIPAPAQSASRGRGRGRVEPSQSSAPAPVVEKTAEPGVDDEIG